MKQNTLKRLLICLYISIIIVMAVATFIEHSKGTEYVSTAIYGSWWFCLLWGGLVFSAIIYLISRHVRNISQVTLHIAFIVILTGALITHLFAIKGIMHIRINETTNEYMVSNKKSGLMDIKHLPFSLKLNKFDINYHNGTSAAQNYISQFTVIEGNNREQKTVSMNEISTYKSVRFCQNSYDEDGMGTYLTINYDPWGITITYIGYAILFISLIWLLIDPKGTYRTLLRNPLIKKGILTLLLFTGISGTANAATTLPEKTAEEFGKLYILYNGRICPLQTFAIDFTKKIYGSNSYGGYSAEQVLAGWILRGNEWTREPIIRIKNQEMRNRLHLGKFTSLDSFFDNTQGGYILGKYISEYNQGNRNEFHKAAIDIDDKIMLLMSLRQMSPLKIFPYTEKGKTVWYSPYEKLPKTMNAQEKLFINNIFSIIYQDMMIMNNAHLNLTIGKIKKYQVQNGGNSIPKESSFKAELIYNSFPFATILFMFNLTMGFLSLFHFIYKLGRNHIGQHIIDNVLFAMLAISFLLLTFCEILRWMISGNLPISNGYETMLLIAWFVILLSLITYRRFHIVLTFGFLLSGFFLLVSHIGQMDPQITPIMPVLSSPLLSIHVSIIMMSFALLSLTFICSIMALLLYALKGRNKKQVTNQIESLHLLSRLFLYPAMSSLGIGIFIGAIWANISWGQYWSWDPKEVWALITFMFYAAAVHTQSLPVFRKPLNYHIFMAIAFVTILMTYFGVNYFLGGMHSYA